MTSTNGSCGDQYVIPSRLVPTGERNFAGKVALLVADGGVLVGGVEVVSLDVVESALLGVEVAALDVAEDESLDEGVGPRRDNKAGPPNAAPPDAPPADPVPPDPPLEPPPEDRPPEVAETPPPAGADGVVLPAAIGVFTLGGVEMPLFGAADIGALEKAGPMDTGFTLQATPAGHRSE
jgi:hypothetical protein